MERYIAVQDLPLKKSLSEAFSQMSVRRLTLFLKQGRVYVNGRPVQDPLYKVFKGDLILLGKRILRLPKELKVCFQDEHILVIDKPKGMLSVATTHIKGIDVFSILKKEFSPVHVVHRLDRDTSGLLLFARSYAVRQRCLEMFVGHKIDRHYVALVCGRFPTKGSWRSYLEEKGDYSVEEVPEGQGALAITHYKNLKKHGKKTLLALTLETGRKHQIRVHCANAGCPVLGDKRYGGKVAKRLYLHAESLHFLHPITAKQMNFHSPLPKSFHKALEGFA